MSRRIRIGATVHTTSIVVLCVVFDGVGLALALNFIITINSRPSTNNEIDRDHVKHEGMKLGDVVHHRGHGILQSQLPRLRHAFRRKSLATGPSQYCAAQNRAHRLPIVQQLIAFRPAPSQGYPQQIGAFSRCCPRPRSTPNLPTSLVSTTITNHCGSQSSACAAYFRGKAPARSKTVSPVRNSRRNSPLLPYFFKIYERMSHVGRRSRTR